MFGNLREDLVLDQRVLRADLLIVQGRVKGLLCFDARSAMTMMYVCDETTSYVIDKTGQG